MPKLHDGAPRRRQVGCAGQADHGERRSMMHWRNREGFSEWDIPENHVERRAVGLSAMVRLRDEETWIAACLTSILPWFDEVVCVIQPCSDPLESVPGPLLRAVGRVVGGRHPVRKAHHLGAKCPQAVDLPPVQVLV